MAADEAKILNIERRNNKVFELTAEEKNLNSAFKEDLSYFTTENCSTKLELDNNKLDIIEIKEEGSLDENKETSLNENNENLVKDEPLEIIQKGIYFYYLYNRI